MTEPEQRAIAKMMKLMAEAVELAWKRDAAASLKVSQAVLIAKTTLGLES